MIDIQNKSLRELNDLSNELNELEEAKEVLLDEINSTKKEINLLSDYKHLIADYQKNKVLITGQSYVDLGSRYKKTNDQFLRWFNIDGSGMGNSSGMRGFKYINIPNKTSLKAFLILITSNVDDDRGNNKWKDKIDLKRKKISYFGDAKLHKTKKAEDWQGNKIVLDIHDDMLEGKNELIPPILHFSKEKIGFMKFNGLCGIKNVERTIHFEKIYKNEKQYNIRVRNYRLDLDIININKIHLDWLHLRRIDYQQSLTKQPKAWTDYISNQRTKT